MPHRRFRFTMQLRAADFDGRFLKFQSDRVTWFRPVTLTDLLALKAQFPLARLVVGNTEIGRSFSSAIVTRNTMHLI